MIYEIGKKIKQRTRKDVYKLEMEFMFGDGDSFKTEELFLKKNNYLTIEILDLFVKLFKINFNRDDANLSEFTSREKNIYYTLVCDDWYEEDYYHGVDEIGEDFLKEDDMEFIETFEESIQYPRECDSDGMSYDMYSLTVSYYDEDGNEHDVKIKGK